MATTRWTGASSTSWTTAGNWTNGVPGNGDIVIFPKTASQGATTNTDLSAASRDLAALYIEEGYSYNVDSTTAPLICTADLISVTGSSTSTLYYTCSAAAGTNTCGLMIVESPNIVNAVTLNDGNKAFTRLDVLQGKVISAESIAYINVQHTARFNNIPVIVYAGADPTTIINQVGGSITTTSGDFCASWLLNGGEAVLQSSAWGTSHVPAIFIMAGLCRNEASSSGIGFSFPDFYVHNGTLDMSRVDDAAATNVFIWPEGTVYQTPDPIATNHYIGVD